LPARPRGERATQRAEILGYHLEQSVRYRNELRPADAQSTILSRRAATHLETAGRAANGRGDALAAVNLLDRAAALLPRQAPALARVYTSLGAALTEAGQLEKATATLDQAQRIAAANGDGGQRAHARVQALLLAYKVDPNGAAVQIARHFPNCAASSSAAWTSWGCAKPCSYRPRCTGTTPSPPLPKTPGATPPNTRAM
jgi:tetratricopeptide (TPR) repeat protein